MSRKPLDSVDMTAFAERLHSESDDERLDVSVIELHVRMLLEGSEAAGRAFFDAIRPR